jgi:hypothetical protein
MIRTQRAALSRKVETGFSEKIMLNQRDEIMMRFLAIAS